MQQQQNKPKKINMKTFKKLSEALKMKGEDPCWKGYQMVGMKDKNGKKVPNCVPEETQVLTKEGAVPSTEQTVKVRHKESGKELIVTRQSLDKYRSVGYEHVREELTPSSVPEPGREAIGGRFQSVASKKPTKPAPAVTSEAVKEEPPFDPDPPKKRSVVPGKFGSGYSTARKLARDAMERVSKKYKKPLKEEDDFSKKAQIVKDAAKNKKKTTTSKDDAFQAEPILSKSQTKNY